MPLDDSDFLRPIARFIAWIIVEFVYEIGFQLFCVWVGRITLLVITLGKYPDSSQAERDEVWIGIFGILVILAAGYFAYDYLS